MKEKLRTSPENNNKNTQNPVVLQSRYKNNLKKIHKKSHKNNYKSMNKNTIEKVICVTFKIGWE
jgi:hypothetical protein